MKATYIKSAGKVVRVDTNLDSFLEVLSGDSIPATVMPGLKVIESSSPDFRLIIDGKSEKQGIELDEAQRTLQIHHREQTQIPRYPLIYSLAYVFNRVYQEGGLFQLHGSAVSRDGEGALILGHEDYGKSRIAMKLCLDFGFKLNGDEKILLDEQSRSIIEGTSLVQMSRDKILYYFPDKRIDNGDFNAERDKVIVDSSDLGIYQQPGHPIRKVFYGHVCPYVPRFVSIEEGDARRKFYENLTINIRGHGFVLLDIDCPYPSLDTPDLGRKRVAFTKDFVKDGNLETYIIRDSLENICDQIDKKMRGKNE